MGAHFFVMPRIGQLVQSKGLKIRSIKRSHKRQPRDWLREGSRTRAKNSIESGIHYRHRLVH